MFRKSVDITKSTEYVCLYFSIYFISFQMAKRVNIRTHPSQLEFGKVESKILLELFPFAVILDHEMRITGAGEKIVETWILQNQNKNPRSFWGSQLVDLFKLRRPKGIVFDWQTVIQLNLVIFELEMMRADSEEDGTEKPVAISLESGKHLGEYEHKGEDEDDDELSCAVEAAQTGENIALENKLRSLNSTLMNIKYECVATCNRTKQKYGSLVISMCVLWFYVHSALDRRGSQGWTRVLLKGQMRYIGDIDSIVFLCSPL